MTGCPYRHTEPPVVTLAPAVVRQVQVPSDLLAQLLLSPPLSYADLVRAYLEDGTP